MLASFAGRFCRVEPRRAAAGFVAGLLSQIESKSCWALAEHAGHARPDAMQRLLYRAVWDADAARDDLRALVVGRLGEPDAVLVVDETGDLKKGTHSAGVARLYSGTAGRIENQQLGVFLGYASRRGHCLIDRRLYLPACWTDDRSRCQAAGVPDTVAFATKPQLAADMIEQAVAAQTPAAWVAGDEAYGNNTALRARLRTLGLGYVLAVACNHHIPLDGGKTHQRLDRVAAGLPDDAWQRRSAGMGSKGPRWYDWAWLGQVSTDADPDDGGHHSVLIRRNTTTGELAFYRCWAPRPVTLAQLVRVAGIRWSVEEGFQTAKGQVGLDQHQVRRWDSWHRFTTLALAALAVLTLCAVDAHRDHARPDHEELINLTVNEIRRLINIWIIHPIRDLTHRMRWSHWRRRHQATARRSHYKRRLSLELQP